LNFITYLLFKVCVYPLSFLPFAILYKISDALYLILYYIFQYRKKVVYNNLQQAFLTKSKKEIASIAKQSYRNLADTLVESVKLFSISQKEFSKRMQLSDATLPNRYFQKKQSVIAISGHFGNWEYGSIMNHFIPHHLVVLFKPLKNPYINKAIVESRSRFGLQIWNNRNTPAFFDQSFTEPYMIVFIGDQNPSNPKKSYWTTFLGRDTCFYSAAAKYALQFNLPILSFYIKRTKRGFYQLVPFQVVNQPQKYTKDELCEKIAREYERLLLLDPANWLWTHKRWKHQKADYTKEVENTLVL